MKYFKIEYSKNGIVYKADEEGNAWYWHDELKIWVSSNYKIGAAYFIGSWPITKSEAYIEIL